MHLLQATHLQHNTLLRKPPAAHTGTQVRFDTFTLQATSCPRRGPGALATLYTASQSSESSMVDATMRGGDLSPQELLLRLTRAVSHPAQLAAVANVPLMARLLTGAHCPKLFSLAVAAWVAADSAEAAGALPPSALCLSAKRFLPSYPKCQELRVQLQVECRVYSTQHLAPKATSCPHRTQVRFDTVQATSCPRRGPGALATTLQTTYLPHSPHNDPSHCHCRARKGNSSDLSGNHLTH